MDIAEQIDRRIAQIYFEQGIKLVYHRWLPWEHREIMLKPNGIEVRGKPCTTSDTRRTSVENTTP